MSGATPAADKRLVFDQVAELYDRARPAYPAALIADIIAYARPPAHARLLEIGCGSGQATLPFARRGYAITCMELGEGMTRIARKNLADYPHVEIRQADFDAASLPDETYDLVYSATAFHWLDAETRFRRAHDCLRPGGALALFWQLPVVTERSRDSFDALQAAYTEFAPELTRDFSPPPHPSAVATDYDRRIAESGLFADLEIKKHYCAKRYNAEAYLDLLNTFSDHRALDPAKRRRLFAGIAAVIDGGFGGEIARETVAILYLARRIRPTASSQARLSRVQCHVSVHAAGAKGPA